MLVIRDKISLLFFNCVTLTVDHFINLNDNYIGIYQNLMHAERENKDLVVYTRAVTNLIELRVKECFK